MNFHTRSRSTFARTIPGALPVVVFLLLFPWRMAQAQAPCDVDRSCVGNALQFPGGDLDYVDVFTTPALERISSSGALTVSMWLAIERQAGVSQFIAGVWGPRTDRDDQWLLYVDERDSLVFAVSNGTTNLGQFDNTVVRSAVAYGQWVHVAAMWDAASAEARLYIDGRLMATARNADYPATSLRGTISYLQLGSFNGLTNDPVAQRPFTGRMDEFRLYDRLLDEDALRCGMRAALQGNESGLILYFRCNEQSGDVLCDASAFSTRGNRRGALRFSASDRVVPPSTFITPAAFSFPLGCISDTTLTVSLVDTSACGEQVTLSLTGPDAGSFSLGATTATLLRNQRVDIPIQTRLRVTGAIRAAVLVRPRNSCNPTVSIPIDIVRNTQLAVSAGRVRFDTLFGCVDRQFVDSTLRICNSTAGVLNVTGLVTGNPAFVALPSGWTLPLQLQPGECRDILLRFAPADTGNFVDTLRILSDDVCPGSGTIPLQGRRMDVLRTTLASIDFDQPPQPCRRSINLAEEFFLRNMSGENFTVEAVEFTNAAFSSPTAMPFLARPNNAYRMYIRFRSNIEGVYSDTARIRINFRGCIVYRSIPVSGRVVDVRLAASDTLLQFGTVLVGQSRTLPVTLSNAGLDTRDVFAYLSSGRAFSINGGTRFTVAPGAVEALGITFRPLGPGLYRDTLNLQDVGCQSIIRVILEGNGEFGTLVFDPPWLQARGVINCRCRIDSIRVRNASAAAITLRSVSLSGSARFSFLPPLPVANEQLPPGGERLYVLQYCPAGAPDFITDIADVRFDTDGPDGELRMLLTGSAVEPRLIIDPVTNYGDVEVGTTQSRVLRVTNTSPTPVRVDAIPGLPAGFSVTAAAPPLGSTLQFRDTMLVTVTFAPLNNSAYGGAIRVESDEPCPIFTEGQLLGRGIIVPLFVPWSTIVFSEVTRCDSVLRIIGLVNDGSVPIRVDSIWITGRDSAAFTWRGRTFGGALPHDVAPRFADSVDILFRPVQSTNVQSFAQLHIAATTRLGQQVYTINLVGGRILQYIPSRALLAFPATPVLNTAATIRVDFQNPSYLETLTIDSLSFLPDQGVFTYTGTLPLVIAPRQTRGLDFAFRPRAAVSHQARVRLVTRVGCVETDTTILCTGEGYTPPWLTRFCIDTTVVANIGDVLRLPVTLNRDIPQNPLDVSMFIGFHRRGLQYLGFEPVYTRQTVRDTLRRDGVTIALRGNEQVRAGTFGWISFRVAASDSMLFPLRTDSIAFASDSTLFLALFGDGCVNTVSINPHCGIRQLAFSAHRYALRQNYPNPSSGTTTVEFETLEDAYIRVELRDTGGRVVALLADGWYTHGAYAVQFDVSGLPAGVYNYVMTAPTFTATRSMMVLR